MTAARAGQGVVIDEPSVVAIETAGGSRHVRAVGSDAKVLIGKTPEHIQKVIKVAAATPDLLIWPYKVTQSMVQDAVMGVEDYHKAHA